MSDACLFLGEQEEGAEEEEDGSAKKEEKRVPFPSIPIRILDPRFALVL